MARFRPPPVESELPLVEQWRQKFESFFDQFFLHDSNISWEGKL